MFENVNIDWNLQHEDGSTDFSDEETLEDAPRTLQRTPERRNNGTRPMSVYNTPSQADLEESPENNRTSDWSRYRLDQGYEPSLKTIAQITVGAKM